MSKITQNEKVAIKSGYYFEIFDKSEMPNSLIKSGTKVQLDNKRYDLYKANTLEDERVIDKMFGDRMGYDIDDHTVKKPKCALIGEDGNIFVLMGVASRTLKQNKMHEEAKEMCNKINAEAKNYDEALLIIGEYVEITSREEMEEDEFY